MLAIAKQSIIPEDVELCHPSELPEDGEKSPNLMDMACGCFIAPRSDLNITRSITYRLLDMREASPRQFWNSNIQLSYNVL